MSAIETLEARINDLLDSYVKMERLLEARDDELARLRAEVARFARERAEIRGRLDAVLAEVDAAVADEDE